MGRMTPACVEDQASLRTTTANSLASLPPALSGLVTHLALLQSRAQAPAGQVQGSSSLASRAEDPAITNADIFDLVQEAVEISFVNKDSVIGSMSSRVAALESHLVAARQELQDAFAKIADLQNGVANSASVSSLDALAARLPPSQEMLPRDALERVFDKLDEDGAVIQQLTETVEAQAEQLRNEVHLANAFRRTTADELVTLKERTAMTEGLASRMPNDKLAGTGDAASNIESLIATAPSIIDINEKLAATEDDHAQLRDGVDRMSLRAQTFEDVARSLAQQFDLLASEQDNCARQVNESREATHAGLSDLSGAVEALQGMAFRRGLQSSLASPPSQLDRSSQLPSQNFSDQELDNSSEHQPPLQRQQRDSQFPAAPSWPSCAFRATASTAPVSPRRWCASIASSTSQPHTVSSHCESIDAHFIWQFGRPCRGFVLLFPSSQQRPIETRRSRPPISWLKQTRARERRTTGHFSSIIPSAVAKITEQSHGRPTVLSATVVTRVLAPL